MSLSPQLTLFLGLLVFEQVLERGLAAKNHAYVHDPEHLATAGERLRIGEADLRAALAYSEDHYRFGRVRAWFGLLVKASFLAAGGLGWFETWALAVTGPASPVATGLVFFALLAAASVLLSLPFDLYETFRIEERHGFNRQTPGGFFRDLAISLVIAALLGGALLGVVLWLMNKGGSWWWLVAWAAASAFFLVTTVLYPMLLAPLFNKFTALPEGELKDAIDALARRVGFRTRGVFVMDASRRSAHGNAYFTGLFGGKRIVLFDTLLGALQPAQTVAVLAHELGHFKLHHVRFALARSLAVTGLALFLLSRVAGFALFVTSFGLRATSAYGALVVFSLWAGVIGFFFTPGFAALSRRNEFAADRFAVAAGCRPEDLRDALLKLRETSRLLPLAHPLYSRVYYSHPPLLERIAVLIPPGRSRPEGATAPPLR